MDKEDYMTSPHFERRKMRWTSLRRACVYCGIEFADTTQFCHSCGRATEKGFCIRPMLRSIYDYRASLKEKEELRRQRGLSSDGKKPMASKLCPYCRLWFPDSAQFCANCGRPIEKDLRHEVAR